MAKRIQPSIREGDSVIQPFTANLQAVCFDLDWTLSAYPLSTREVLEQALSRASMSADLLGDLTIAADQYDALWLTLERSSPSTDALRVQILSAMFAQRGLGHEDGVVAIAKAYGDIRRETGVCLYPGVDRLLADLGSRYMLGLLTNGPTDISWEKIRSLGLDRLFDAVIVAGDVGIYKPDVEVFELLLDALGAAAHRSIFVGDTYGTDIVGAAQAGMHTAWIKREGYAIDDQSIQPTLIRADTAQLREDLL